MSNLFYPDNSFDFDLLTLGTPNGLKGGSYLSKLLINNNSFLLQLPKCSTKQGIVSTEKKVYCDLMYSKDDESIISWFEDLEQNIQNLIFDKKNLWFNSDLDMNDIEDAFSSPLKSYKSGKHYLLRCYLAKNDSILCYDEHEENVSLDEINNKDYKIIPLVEVSGIKFSSKNFQIELILKQLMVIKSTPLNTHLIKHIKPDSETETEPETNLETETEKNLETETNLEPETNQETETETNLETETEKNLETEKKLETETKLAPELETKLAPELETKHEPESEKKHEQEPEKNQEIKIDVETIKEVNSIKCVEKDNNKKDTVPLKKEGIPSEEGSNGTFPLEYLNLEEISIDLDSLEQNSDDVMKIKKPEHVYYETWKRAKEKLRYFRSEAVKAYLEAKNIKEKYLVDEINSDSENELESDFSLNFQ